MVTWVFTIDSSFSSSGISTSVQNTILGLFDAAGVVWSRYLGDSDAVIEVEISTVSLEGSALAQAGPNELVDLFGIYASNVTYEIRTGIDSNGAVFDAGVTLDLDRLLEDEFYFDPDPYERSGNIPSGQYDLFSIILHELGHPLGFIDAPGGNMSEFESLISFEFNGDRKFNGQSAIELWGSPPPIVSDSPHFDIYGSGPIMSPTIGTRERQYITPLDVAVLDDLGINVPKPTAGADVIYGFEGIGGEIKNLLAGDDFFQGFDGPVKVYGGDGNDSIFGGSKDDSLYGENGSDSLEGGAGADYLSGGVAGADDGDDSIYGGEGKDTLFGFDGDDLLNAGDDDDSLIGSAGFDTLNGGGGFDFVDYSASSAGVSINLDTGFASGGDAEGDVLISIEGIYGTSFADTLIGNDSDNELRGSTDDYLIGGGGADKFVKSSGKSPWISYITSPGGVHIDLTMGVIQFNDAEGDDFIGIDIIEGSQFDDTLIADRGELYGGDGADLLAGDSLSPLGKDTLNGGSGNDTLIGYGGFDELFGGDGDDSILGGDGGDFIEGAAGNDALDGGEGEDTLSFAASGAAVSVDFANSLFSGGDAEGDVIINFESAFGSGFDDTLIGDDSDNNLSGGAGVDSISGGQGDDVIAGGAGADILDGGDGIGDILSYDESTAAVVVNLATEVASGGDADGDVISNFEGVNGTVFADLLVGGDSADSLRGGGGDDTLVGGAGADTLRGLSGIDWISYEHSVAGVMINLLNNTASGGDAEGDYLSQVENIIGSGFNDALTANSSRGVLFGLGGDDTLIGSTASGLGGAGRDELFGGDGDDFIMGKGGVDSLDGGAGNDTLNGGRYGDVLNGGAGQDWADYTYSSIAVNVSLLTGSGSAGDAAGDVLNNIENLLGSGFGDDLSGDHAANIIDGAAGHDTLRGAGGADVFLGGSGADVHYGGGGFDEMNYAASPDSVSINLGLSTASGGYAQGDSFNSVENLTGSNLADVLVGDEAANRINGGDGADSISGEGGDDVLVGGLADDSLLGGFGDDTLDGGDDNDSLEGFAGRDSLFGGEGDDFLHGYRSHDSLYGGAGDDDLRGGYGKDLINGSGGNDILRGFEGDDRMFGGGGDDTLLGNDDNDSLTGGGGADRLKGDAGDDTLNGRFGADTVTGGEGDDIFEFRFGHDADTFDDFIAGAGTDDAIMLIAFGAAFDTFAEVIAAASDNGNHTTIDFGGGDSILLLNVVVGDLHEDDFIFT